MGSSVVRERFCTVSVLRGFITRTGAIFCISMLSRSVAVYALLISWLFARSRVTSGAFIDEAEASRAFAVRISKFRVPEFLSFALRMLASRALRSRVPALRGRVSAGGRGESFAEGRAGGGRGCNVRLPRRHG